MHHSAHPSLQRCLVQGSGASSHPHIQPSPWSCFGSGQEEECVQASPPYGGFRSALTPKGQNQHSKPKTQPLLQKENYSRLHSPFQLCFLSDFGTNSSPPFLGRVPVTRQVTPVALSRRARVHPWATASSSQMATTGSLRGSRLPVADRTKVATVGTCDEVGVLRRFFLADFRMTLLLTSSRVMAE